MLIACHPTWHVHNPSQQAPTWRFEYPHGGNGHTPPLLLRPPPATFRRIPDLTRSTRPLRLLRRSKPSGALTGPLGLLPPALAAALMHHHRCLLAISTAGAPAGRAYL
eukprot:366029-Chlamydomonas_euryale.AAC.45